jgi:hypothetical protein
MVPVLINIYTDANVQTAIVFGSKVVIRNDHVYVSEHLVFPIMKRVLVEDICLLITGY